MTRFEVEKELLYQLKIDEYFTQVIDRLTTRRARVRAKIEETRKLLAGQRLLFEEPSQGRR